MVAINRYVLSVLVENHAGVLSKISGLFSRRGYNIESLSVGITEDPKISRMTIVIDGDEYIVEQISKQLNKLITVIKVIRIEPNKSVFREIALVKVCATQEKRTYIMQFVDIFRGSIIDVDEESMTIEITGDEGKVNGFIERMRLYGIKEIVRTGLTAIERGSKTIENR